MSRLTAVALVLSGALASMLFCGWLIVGHIESDAGALAEAREEGYAAAEEDRLAIVVDRPIAEGNSMPLWLQTDPQWDYIPYAGGTIGDHGCGLTCAAMAVKYMTLQDITPLTLASFVGDTCLTDGVNDPGKFCAWIAEHYPEYGIESTPISYDLAPVLQNVSDGWLAFAGMSGTLGDRDYGGHVVLI